MPLDASEPSAATPADRRASSWTAADELGDVGLAGLHRHLERVASRLGVRALTVVVHDPDLGRQAFRSGSGRIEPGAISAGTGVLTEPATPTGELDAELLVALCAASLRVDVLRETIDPTGELALRRLPGVFAVELENDGELTICRVHVGADAPDDVGRVAARALLASGGARLVVEVVRTTSPPAPTPSPPTPVTPSEAAHAPPSADTISLLAVRSVPEDGEIEVHLALGGARAVGRASLSRGLAGAAEAVLAAVTQVTLHSGWRPSWVRTVETTADGQFVVASALVDPDTEQHRHGIATGSSPIEAAARATVVALA